MTTPPIPLYTSFDRRLVGLHEIKGIDPDVVTFCVEMDLAPDSPIDVDAWDTSALQTLALLHQPILRPRTWHDDGRPKDYWAVGNLGLLHSLQRMRHPPKDFPVQVATRRLFRHEKIVLNATELLGMAAMFRTRPRMQERLFELSQRLSQVGVPLFVDDNALGFRRATGYSLRPVKKEPRADHSAQDGIGAAQ